MEKSLISRFLFTKYQDFNLNFVDKKQKDFSVNYYTPKPVKKQALIKTQEKFIKKINKKIKILS